MGTLNNTFFKIRDSKRLSQLVILVSFLITFTVVRYITTLQKLEVLPNQTDELLHIHHMVPGILLLLTSGYFGLSFWNQRRLRLIMSVLFGVGAALTIDEFALWLFLRDVYWEAQGRTSVDAVIITIVILTIAFIISEIHDHRHVKRIFGRKVERR